MRRSLIAAGMTLGCLAGTGLFVESNSQFGLFAQSVQKKSESRRSKSRSGKSAKPINAKSLNARIDKAKEQFIKETLNVAKEFEEGGQLEKAKQLYQSVLKIRSNLPKVRERVKEIDETILSSNEHKFDIDVTQGWGSPRARVFEGKGIRLQAEGKYRFVTNLPLGPNGFPTDSPEKGGMAPGVPCGALMGLIVGKDKSGKPKPGKPFNLGSSREFTPKEDGLLFLRVNLPPGHKCSGKITVTMSGYVRAG